MSASDVVTTLVAAGIQPADVRAETIRTGSPSGPPMTETEAVSFSLASIAPHGGRIMVFADDDGIRQKAAWFRRTGVDVVVHGNALVWLHPQLGAGEVAQIRAALASGG